jgi:hypothetical protein
MGKCLTPAGMANMKNTKYGKCCKDVGGECKLIQKLWKAV